MNDFWLFPLLALGTLLWVAWPLLTRRGNRPLPAGVEDDPRLPWDARRDALLEQLAALEAEIPATSGTPATGQVRQALETELAQVFARLDAMEKKSSRQRRHGHTTNDGLSPAHRLAGGLTLFILLALGSGLYVLMGHPDRTGGGGHAAAPAAGGPDTMGRNEMEAMVDRYAQRMQEEPENRDGWMRLARSYVALERIPDAIAALNHILRLAPDDTDAMSTLARLRIQSEDESMIQQGRQDYETLLTRDPEHAEALWFLGALAYRSGARRQALDYWLRLEPLLPDGSSMRATLEEAIRDARALPEPEPAS